jgi:hypothetical protein
MALRTTSAFVFDKLIRFHVVTVAECETYSTVGKQIKAFSSMLLIVVRTVFKKHVIETT